MSEPTPLWREMLAASEESLRGREFESLEEADRVVAEAHIQAVKLFLYRRLGIGPVRVFALLIREQDKARRGDQM
jgi:hypothetical protein